MTPLDSLIAFSIFFGFPVLLFGWAMWYTTKDL